MKTHAKPQANTHALTRRHFMQASAAVGTGVAMLPNAQAAGNSLEGYAAATSVVVGGTLDFFFRDPQAVGVGTTPYPVTFTRIGAPDVFMFNTTVAIGNQVVPANATTNGCAWAMNYRLSVPANWPSGLYYAYVGSGENATTVPFVVRPASATAGVKRLLAIPVTTIHAYNEYGGKSLYDYNSSGGVRAPKVSLDRPLTQSFNSFFDTYAQYFVRWMAKNNLAVDFCTDLDIEANPALLDPYQLYIQAGHDEYWTFARRQTMDAFVARGGNCAYLAGNTAWFRIRMEPSAGGVANRTIVCYKDAAADPVSDPNQKTINFYALPTPYPENVSMGLGFRKGCSWAGALPRPITPTVVKRAEHWAFAGTGLALGNQFGGEYVGYESDAADFVLGGDQRPYATGADSSPNTLRILGIADASNWDALSQAQGGGGELSGYAMIAVFSRGGTAGTVFNAGSTDWSYGLRPEIDGQTPTPISRITRNVIDKLSAPWTETADVRQYRTPLGSLQSYYYGVGTTAPTGSGMTLDGWVFRCFPVSVSGSVPIYRFRSTAANVPSRTYRLSTSATVPGSAGQFAADGVAFHAYPSARTGAAAIYEHTAFNSTAGLTTVYYSPVATPPAGWTAGPIRFYAPTSEGLSVAAPPPPPPSFTLGTAAASLTVVRGQGSSTAVTVSPSNGFAGVVSFTASGLPSGVTASFSPASSSSGSTLTLAASSTAATGSYTVTVTGTSPANGTTPAVVATKTLTVVVSLAPGFSLQANDNSVFMSFGGIFGDSVSFNVVKAGGFNSAVAFTVSGLPNGMNATFSPTSSTSGTVLNLKAASIFGAQRGFFTLTIKGTSGSLNAQVNVSLTVL